MINFKILKKSKNSRARLGFIETSHGVIETPCLVPVATQAVVKTLTSEEVVQTKSQVLISNTFHLHLKPGEKIIEKAGGLHKFMNWKKPLMTDSGGYQVFSLGFGRDFGVGKILKNFVDRGDSVIKEATQPKSIKITENGVYFQSPIDGTYLFLGPKESTKIQEKLGADIIFTFDECTAPLANSDYIKSSLKKTHNWAEICLKTKKSNQAMFGIIQGSRFKNLREESANLINSLEFDGFGIGGDLGHDRKSTKNILDWTVPILNEKKPRHLLGIGYLEDMEPIIKSGIDLFDCTVPTHYARRGVAFTSEGKLNLKQTKFLKKREPLDKECICYVCQSYKKDYISHLLKANEITALKLLTFHNLFYFNSFVEDIREKIKKGEI
ncbi:MAG: tRNA guanosine(34) transglycosylase Tgt [bacterium]|nr:tRNA guanosine(34) transglycosylase Tgt [bacterium]